MSTRQCLLCGMTATVTTFTFNNKQVQYCPKCDAELLAQTDGSCLTQDIAHQRESTLEALDKLEILLNEAFHGYYQSLRIIVGGGLIKDEVLRQLYFYKDEGYILSYNLEKNNRGAIMIQIRQP